MPNDSIDATMTQKVFRPTLDDVERLSLGKGARKRGTGSRHIPHRLNQDERQLYGQAKNNLYLIIKGTAYRRERKGSPLCNTFRQRCDALNQIYVVVKKYCGGDRVEIDFSTLRVKDDAVHVVQIIELLKKKYPEMMDNNVINNCSEKQLDFNAIHNNPIWNVEPRLLIVDSITDRSVAKSIAEDAVKHTFNFVRDDIENVALDREDCVATNNLSDKVSLETNEKNFGTSCDEIDWNDI